LVGLPGANVYFTDNDETTPVRPDGTRAVTCKQISAGKALYDLAKAARYLSRVVELL
jgi:hypothetical protein